MTVNDYYKLVLYASAKNQSQGYVSPADFNVVINQAQRMYTTFLLGNLQSYTPGRPISKVELGQNSVVRQRLSPVIYGYNLNVDSTGFSPYPGDYLQTDAMWSIYGRNRIRYAAQEKLYSLYNSTIDPIAANPIYLIEDLGFRFYPENIANAKLSYIREAGEIYYAFTYDSNNRPVYDPVNSKQPVWDETSSWDIIVRALALIGVNLQLNTLIGYANEIKANGA